jgi:Uma2 family endonuclease
MSPARQRFTFDEYLLLEEKLSHYQTILGLEEVVLVARR